MTDTLAGLVLLVIGVAAFNNYQQGTLGPWLRAKFLNQADPAGPGQALVRRPSSAPAAPVDPEGHTGAPQGPPGAPVAAPVKPGDLVTVNGILVHRSAAASLQAMVDSARQSGVELTGGGFRTHAEQVGLRVAHGCAGPLINDPKCKGKPPTAVPGTSMHELGLAVDFHRCQSHSSPVFLWLAANAGRYGWKNLPSEPWHWSTGSRAGS